MSIAQEQANIYRAEAKKLLNSAFGFEENIVSEAVNKTVDCIIAAAILEISAIHQDAMKQLASANS